MKTLLLRILAVLAFCIFAANVVSAVRHVGQTYPGFLMQDNHYFQNRALGLTVWSQIDTANGRPIKANEDIQRLVESVPLGTDITYGYTDRGEALTFVARTARYTWSDFARDMLPPLLGALPFLIVGVISFATRPDNPAARAHLILTVCMGVAGSALVDWYWGSLFKPWIEPFAITVTYMQGAALMHLALVFPQPRRLLQRFPAASYLPYLGAGALCLYGYSHWIAQWLRDGSWDVHVQGTFGWTIAFWIMASYLLGYGGMGEAMFRAPTLTARRQARVALTGLFFSALPFFALDLIPMQFGYRVPYAAWQEVVSVGAPVLFPLAVAYAIVRHQMFDIELVIKRTVVYGVVIAVLGGLYAAILAAIGFLVAWVSPAQAAVATGAVPGGTAWPNVLASAAVAIGFAPLRDRVRSWVDARFFRSSYQFDRVVAEFGEVLRGGHPEAKALLGPYLVTIGKTLHPEYLAALFRPEGADELVLVEAVGLSHLEGMVLPLDHPAVAEVRVRNLPVAEAPADFGPLQGALLIPLSVSGRLAGAILAGPRKSGLAYDDADRLLLGTLAQQFEKRLEQDELDRSDAMALRARTALSRYVSAQVADTVLQEHFDYSEGRRQEVTLLFSDIRGFTKLSETMAPEEVVSLLNAYFTRMAAAVFAYDGMLDKFIGDGMMVVFGAPVARADHAWRAVQAALRMRAELAAFNAEREAAGKFTLKIGVGLHSGDVVVGNIGSDQRLDYTAIGDTVNTASRIESLTKEHGADILMSAATYEHVRDRVVARHIPGVAIRGKEQALDLFALDSLQTQSELARGVEGLGETP